MKPVRSFTLPEGWSVVKKDGMTRVVCPAGHLANLRVLDIDGCPKYIPLSVVCHKCGEEVKV